ncbi:MAG: 50S ribosomal protein L25 [Phycisphaerae bacterium]
MEQQTLKATRREQIGTKHTRRLRKKGDLPAIIYGHGEKPEPVALSLHEVEVELLHGARILNLDLGTKDKQQFLIKDVQYDYLGTNPLHLDLLRVDLDEKVTLKVAVELKGTPKGVSNGGVLDQHLGEIEVECLMTQIPETLTPLVTHIDIGDTLLVGDLELPPGVTALTGAEERVASVTVLAEETETAEELPEGESAEPEIIAKGKKEEETPGEKS